MFPILLRIDVDDILKCTLVWHKDEIGGPRKNRTVVIFMAVLLFVLSLKQSYCNFSVNFTSALSLMNMHRA